MQIKLYNAGGEIGVWESVAELVRDLQRGYVKLAVGDTLKITEMTQEDALSDFNYVGSPHHY